MHTVYLQYLFACFDFFILYLHLPLFSRNIIYYRIVKKNSNADGFTSNLFVAK